MRTAHQLVQFGGRFVAEFRLLADKDCDEDIFWLGGTVTSWKF
ncbi:hypothetical protein [Alloyangia pacifica]|nr:hypothetical protein [Alloyangia pacifica]